jgi:hypothetical protein
VKKDTPYIAMLVFYDNQHYFIVIFIYLFFWFKKGLYYVLISGLYTPLQYNIKNTLNIKFFRVFLYIAAFY